MITGLAWFFSVFWLLLAVAAFTRLRPRSPGSVALYWLCSWLGQTFAVQLGMLSLIGAAMLLYREHNNLPGLIFLIDAWLFLRMHLLGHRTARVIDKAVAEACAQLKGEVPPLATGSPSRLWAGFRPFNYGTGVTRRKNIPYGDLPGRDNLLDIYQPTQKPSTPMPILIQVPGGAWITGSKDQQALPLLHSMARQGWTCFAINYRLGPVHRFPAMLEDVLKAIAWVKAHAADYGANPDYVVLTGGSAGGHLTSLAALLRNRARFQPGFESADTRVNLAVPFYGRYDFLNSHGLLPGSGMEPFLVAKVMPAPLKEARELWEDATPILQVHREAPPFFVIHGSHDALIPVEEGRHFVEALEGMSGAPVHYAEIPLADHAFDIFNSSFCMPTIDGVTRYLVAHHADYLSRRGQ